MKKLLIVVVSVLLTFNLTAQNFPVFVKSNFLNNVNSSTASGTLNDVSKNDYVFAVVSVQASESFASIPNGWTEFSIATVNGLSVGIYYRKFSPTDPNATFGNQSFSYTFSGTRPWSLTLFSVGGINPNSLLSPSATPGNNASTDTQISNDGSQGAKVGSRKSENNANGAATRVFVVHVTESNLGGSQGFNNSVFAAINASNQDKKSDVTINSINNSGVSQYPSSIVLSYKITTQDTYGLKVTTSTTGGNKKYQSIQFFVTGQTPTFDPFGPKTVAPCGTVTVSGAAIGTSPQVQLIQGSSTIECQNETVNISGNTLQFTVPANTAAGTYTIRVTTGTGGNSYNLSGSLTVSGTALCQNLDYKIFEDLSGNIKTFSSNLYQYNTNSGWLYSSQTSLDPGRRFFIDYPVVMDRALTVNGNIYLNETNSINSPDYDAPGAAITNPTNLNLTVNGSWINTEGITAFTPGTGTVTFGNHPTANPASVNITGVTRFNNLTISASSTLGLSSDEPNDSDIEVAGNITNNGTFSAGTNKVTLNGGAQTISGNALSFHTLEINGAGNKTLNTPVSITSNMNFIDGYVISSSTNKVIFNNGSTVTGTSSSSYVRGPVEKFGSTQGQTFSFPVGRVTSGSNFYLPVSMTYSATDANTDFVVTPYDANPTSPISNAFLSSYSQTPSLVNGFYLDIHNVTWGASGQVAPANGVDLSLKYNKTPSLMITTGLGGGAIYIAHHLSSGNNWEIPTSNLQSATWENGDQAVTIVLPKQKSFSYYGAAVTAAPLLPVSLISVATNLNENKTVSIVWKTATESNNKGFEIQRSIGNTNDFKTIGFVGTRAKDGNSQTEIAYSFEDADVKAGQTHYYRLNQLDFDGKATFSPVRSVKPGSIESNLNVYPNPSQGNVTVNTGSASGKLNIYVIDNGGRVVNQYINVSTSNTRINNLKKGFYTLKLVNTETGEQSAQRVVVQ